jgi:hypothetical protein
MLQTELDIRYSLLQLSFFSQFVLSPQNSKARLLLWPFLAQLARRAPGRSL